MIFCPACGKKNSLEAKFCGKCGEKLLSKTKVNVQEKFPPTNEELAENRGILIKVIDYGLSLIAIGLGYVFGWIMILVIIVPFLIGGWFSKRFAKKVDTSFIQVIVWSNIFTWFLPVLGYFTAGATLGFSDLKTEKDRKKMIVLGSIGLTLSLINSIAGVLI